MIKSICFLLVCATAAQALYTKCKFLIVNLFPLLFEKKSTLYHKFLINAWLNLSNE